jgi:hypothetical protein
MDRRLSSWLVGKRSHEVRNVRRYLKLRLPLLVFSCVALLLALDLLYTRVVLPRLPKGRVSHADYHHGLAANFSGSEKWGELTLRLVTNSLGLRDSSVREVPARSAARRVVVIGDSFTEGLGVNFEESFVGLLHEAGQARPEQAEFLNAGVTSYSPVIYYRKIKSLLKAGVRFGELVVLSDISDVQDEATSYFCIDEHPEYQRFCATLGNGANEKWISAKTPLDAYFVVTSRTVSLLQDKWSARPGDFEELMGARGGWTLPDADVAPSYAPLGVGGGVERSLRNMGLLADLLRQHRIALTVAVYPWPLQLERDDRESRQVRIWQDFCARYGARFVNMFPAFFAIKDAHPDWRERLYIPRDVHLTVEGNRLAFRLLKDRLL